MKMIKNCSEKTKKYLYHKLRFEEKALGDFTSKTLSFEDKLVSREVVVKVEILEYTLIDEPEKKNRLYENDIH